jgi:hypothetical protein
VKPKSKSLGQNGQKPVLEREVTLTYSSQKFGQIANGLNNLTHWNDHLHLRKLAPSVVTGYVMDAVVGGSHINWAYSPSDTNMSFEAFFARVNDYSGIQTRHPEKVASTRGVW